MTTRSSSHVGSAGRANLTSLARLTLMCGKFWLSSEGGGGNARLQATSKTLRTYPYRHFRSLRRGVNGWLNQPTK
jgi:hypothetical protein